MTHLDTVADPLHHTFDLLLDRLQWQGSQHVGRAAAVCLLALRAGLKAHVDEESRWCRCVAASAHTDVLRRVQEQSSAISQRAGELQEALAEDDFFRATSCAVDLKEMLALHLEYEREHLAPLVEGAGGARA